VAANLAGLVVWRYATRHADATTAAMTANEITTTNGAAMVTEAKPDLRKLIS
jgi:hypothetical protein